MNKMGVKVCPKCKSEKITMITGGLTGMWECKSCKYQNDIFPERDEVMVNKIEDKNDTK